MIIGLSWSTYSAPDASILRQPSSWSRSSSSPRAEHAATQTTSTATTEQAPTSSKPTTREAMKLTRMRPKKAKMGRKTLKKSKSRKKPNPSKKSLRKSLKRRMMLTMDSSWPLLKYVSLPIPWLAERMDLFVCFVGMMWFCDDYCALSLPMNY